jgi:hypothetical protein
MLDADLAELYEVPVKVLNQAVKRNRDRFPDDFMFQLTIEETTLARSPYVITDDPGAPSLRSQIVTLKRGQHRKYPAFAFTEEGIAMLSSVLRSGRAVRVNVEIMRAFVRLRQILASHADLARKLEALEGKYDAQFKVVFDAIRQLMQKPKPEPEPPKRKIGFHVSEPIAKYHPNGRRGRS